MDPSKVKGVTDWPIPKNRKELWSSLGFLNFYRRFIEGFASTAHPLNALTSEKNSFEWTSTCQQAFDTLKAKITQAPALRMPTDTDPFHIEMDGSRIGIGAILIQKQDNRWHPIAYISRSLNDAKRNYHTADLKMLAIIFALKEWCQYLLDAHKPFTILTDHKNLEYFTKPKILATNRPDGTRSDKNIIMSSNISPAKLTQRTLCPRGQTLKRG